MVQVSQETQRLWKEITIRRYAWNRRQELAASLATLTLSEIGAFARELLRVKAHSMGVWIYGKGSEVPEDAAPIPICRCMCVCVCIYIYIHTYTYVRTHTWRCRRTRR